MLPVLVDITLKGIRFNREQCERKMQEMRQKESQILKYLKDQAGVQVVSRAAVGAYDAASGRLTLVSGCQGVHRVRGALCAALKLPPERVLARQWNVGRPAVRAPVQPMSGGSPRMPGRAFPGWPR